MNTYNEIIKRFDKSNKYIFLNNLEELIKANPSMFLEYIKNYKKGDIKK